MTVSASDREILRNLAGQVARIAASEQNHRNRQLLTDLNSLKADRPAVLCFPEGAWPELVNPDQCECTDPLLQNWELHFRSVIYLRTQICDDNAIEPAFYVRWVTNPCDFGVNIEYSHGSDRGSYTWSPPLKELPGDISQLKFRSPSVDRAETMRQLAMAEEIFGDLLDVQIAGRGFCWTCGLTATAISLIGLEDFMFAMYDNSDGLHALMQWLSDEMLNYIEYFERKELYTLNNADGYTGSGGSAYTTELPGDDYKTGDPVKLHHLWGFAESQETVGVSPEMFGEFIFPYQLPLLEKFGLNCYGCCEPVDKRWDYIKQVPRLRRVSISPWCDQQVMADTLGGDYIFSRKPNPAHICAGFNIDAARDDVANTLKVARDCQLEIIMKDTHTLQNQPVRLAKWVQCVRSLIDG